MLAQAGMKEAQMQDKNNQAAVPPSQAIRLETLVDYAAGAVVSRTLAKNTAGTLTLFAFDEGQGLSEHSAPFDAWVQVLDGTVELLIGGQKVMASIGETVLMPANIPHGLTAIKPFKMLLTMIRG
jgi:quercetin dioxygenase-like cupin family protein